MGNMIPVFATPGSLLAIFIVALSWHGPGYGLVKIVLVFAESVEMC